MRQYDITGMSCAACSARVEKAVSGLAGVNNCSVNLLTNSMNVDGPASDEDIITAVEKAGYGASLRGQVVKKTDPREKKSNSLVLRLIFSLVFLIALMYFSMGHMLGVPLPSVLESNPGALGLIQLLLSAAVMVINQKFFISGFKGVINKSPNMDTLVALGSSAAFGYSTYVLFKMLLNANPHGIHDLYFESAAMILALITVGKMLEERSKGKTTDAINSLLRLAPKTATVVCDGKEITVSVENVRRGDIFIVRPGESIPVDGVVVEGESAVNEASLTGESIPIDKTVGDTVSAATANQSGYLRCEAVRVGEDTTISQIIKLVSDASASKAPIAKIADKVSGVFVPIVIVIALVTTAVWLLVGQDIGFAVTRGISVLVISCPCALGLATPVAIMVGNGVGAKRGILFKTAASLENAGKSDIVVLDKTGTITEGEPKVTDIVTADDIDQETLLALAYSLEKMSEHPLAKAVVVKAEADGICALSVTEFKALSGSGVEGYIDKAKIVGGSRKYVASLVEIGDEPLKTADLLSDEGKTPLFFARDKKFLGIIAVSDTVKADSASAIRQLQQMGLRVVMLTGDNQKTASSIGKTVGVDEVIAGVLPDAKEQAIRELQESGKIIMVGDGINDAPALTSADTGIAIGAGTDIAIDAADVVLVNSRLSDVASAIKLSRATLRNIRQNLFWAFFYNMIGIPLAAGLFIPLLGWEMNPMFGAAAMSLSSICVVTNALRLNFAKLKNKPAKEKSNMNKVMKLNVEGMMCEHCAARVKTAIEKLEEVKEARVYLDKGIVEVEIALPLDDFVVVKTIEEAGYKVV